MSDFGDRLRCARVRLSISQSALARAARVSLATVQNIEAGRANPSLSTLTDVLAPLGLGVELAPRPADWDALVALGLPLQGTAHPHVTRDLDTLRRHVGRAADELDREPGAPGAERRRECLAALLLALHTHFPSTTRRWFDGSSQIAALLPAEPTGRVIKLSRIARARLAEYL